MAQMSSADRHQRRRVPSLRVRRRRTAAAAVAVGAAVALSLPLGLLGSAPLAASGQAAGRGGATRSYVVQPGDTLWSIARRIDPRDDPRPLVEAMMSTMGGATLQVGERLTLP